MKKIKFPQVLHVVAEYPRDAAPFLVVTPGGPADVDETQPMAIYVLKEVGTAVVSHAFKPQK